MAENDVKTIFAKNILRLRNSKGLTQLELGEKLELGKTTISQWESAKKLPNAGSIEKIASFFNIPKSTLFEEESDQIVSFGRQINLPIVHTVDLENGKPSYTGIVSYVPTPEEWLQGKEHFYILASDDAMMNARIFNGDLVLIEACSAVADGDIAAVVIDGKITLRRIFTQTNILQSENPKFPPRLYDDNCKLIGRVKKLIINF